MAIPTITHLQFFLLEAIAVEPRYGETLRRLLRQERHEASEPAFYQLMGRMEKAGLIRSKIVKSWVAAQLIKERVYRLTAAGKRTLCEVREFYAARERIRLPGKAPIC